MLWKPVVLIGAPSNGKWFWRKQSDPTQRLTHGGGGERKPPLIALYRSSRSTARDVRTTLDLGNLDWMAEIAPDGGSGIDEGLSRICKDLRSV